jgi:hypothetical protein
VTRASVFLALFVVGSVLLVATVRQVAVGARAIRACDDARERGDERGALTFAHRAAEARAPGSPYPEMGYARLRSIARSAESRADLGTAQAAWMAVRAAALATRAIGGANGHLPEANEALVHLATHPRAVRGETEPTVPRALLIESLARDPMPATWVLILLALGGGAFLGGAAHLASLPAATTKKARVSLLISMMGLGLYILACTRG